MSYKIYLYNYLWQKLLSYFIMADVMPKVVADVVTNNIFHFICDRCKANVVDVAATYSMVGWCWCQSGRWKATLRMTDVVAIGVDGMAT